ncbi:MAG: hypothetical protein HY975_03205 [Candidatus Kerfeldbacteria bacterium]|nr:hypothetical protein [Candidatus Kerfeldbacteria bacterium]
MMYRYSPATRRVVRRILDQYHVWQEVYHRPWQTRRWWPRRNATRTMVPRVRIQAA